MGPARTPAAFALVLLVLLELCAADECAQRKLELRENEAEIARLSLAAERLRVEVETTCGAEEEEERISNNNNSTGISSKAAELRSLQRKRQHKQHKQARSPHQKPQQKQVRLHSPQQQVPSSHT